MRPTSSRVGNFLENNPPTGEDREVYELPKVRLPANLPVGRNNDGVHE